ncbi:MAG: tyrosine-type recombinase/integrase [Planctomycetaceae bacterium]|nr:tyrosine-type recombinase/integrase [Planctomycetaceae bacterium]
MSVRTPSYRLHKPSGQAVVTLSGRDFYLGVHDSPQSRAEYDRLVAEWLQNNRVAPTNDLTICEMLLAYVVHCEEYYRRPDKTPTGEAESIKQSIRPLVKLYGHTAARAFSPMKLKACREAMIDAGLCRNECNKRTRRLVRAFKWAVENELVHPDVWQRLKAVEALHPGRSRAAERKPVEPVSDEHVDAILPYVLPPVAAMIQLQRITGMRSGEVVSLRAIDIDQSQEVWVYRPSHHKTLHHGHERLIAIGPKGQQILRSWLAADPEAPLFSPRQAMEQLATEKRARRKTKVQPSQRSRRKPVTRRRPRDRYDTHSYYYAIRRACLKANVPPWHPHQLRHSCATELRKSFGIDGARVVLGHRSAQITETYAQLDVTKAIDIMARHG